MKMLSYHLKIDRCYIDERANSASMGCSIKFEKKLFLENNYFKKIENFNQKIKTRARVHALALARAGQLASPS
jgi:hypothetical protein